MSPLSPVCCSLSRLLSSVVRLFGGAAIWAAAASCSQAELVLSLEQLGGVPASSTPGQQTLVTMALKAEITGSAPDPTTGFDLYSFATGISWSTSTPGVSNSDLYTVDIQGDPVSDNSAWDVSIFAGLTIDPNVLSVESTNEIFLSATLQSSNDSPPLSGEMTIATISFGVSQDISQADFNLNILDTADDPNQYVFVTPDFSVEDFRGTQASLQVVPEPQAIGGVLFAVVLSVGWRMTRRPMKPRGESALSC